MTDAVETMVATMDAMMAAGQAAAIVAAAWNCANVAVVARVDVMMDAMTDAADRLAADAVRMYQSKGKFIQYKLNNFRLNLLKTLMRF